MHAPGSRCADLQAVAIGATNLTFTIVAMTIIDKVGRKKLLLVGSVALWAGCKGNGVHGGA